MFTGIIQDIGRLEKKELTTRGGVLVVRSKKLRPAMGASIAVNGVCLTVTKRVSGGFHVDVVPETLRKTNIGELEKGAALNLEPSLTLRDGLHGHLVAGHIDGVAKIIRTGEELTVKIPKKLLPFVAEKGSVSLNGVSLTIARLHKDLLTVAIIPTTHRDTNLGKVSIGDQLNLEVDLMARYLYRFSRL